MEISRGFGSDNHASVHPEIMAALIAVNHGHAPSYGMDSWTVQAKESFRAHFGSEVDIFFVFNGTAANVLCLRQLLKSHEAVICADTSHLAQDECGAPEFHGGHKLLTVATPDGKLRPQDLEALLVRRGDQHAVQPRLISVTQPTEWGTVYTVEELKALKNFCRQHGLFLHMDGARLANAVVYLQTTFKALTTEVGVDALSFGGTKNGLMGGEAVLFFGEARHSDFRYLQKQEMQLPSKMRFLSAQFAAYLGKDLWAQMAKHALDLAQELAESLARVPELEVVQKVQSNAVFVRFPQAWVRPLKETCFFYVWDERAWIARLMLSHDNTGEDIRRFRSAVDTLRVSQKEL